MAYFGRAFTIVAQSRYGRYCKVLCNSYNTITKERDSNGSMSTKDNVSVNPNTGITSIRVLKTSTGPFENADMRKQSTDRVEDIWIMNY